VQGKQIFPFKMLSQMLSQMTKYRLAIALLWSIGFTSLVSLLLNVHLVFAVFLLPGGLATAVLPSTIPDQNFLLFAANVIFYFVLILLLSRSVGLAEVRRVAGWSVLPVCALAILACFHSFNPLWPHGMRELAKQESELQTAIPLGIRLDQVRGVLNSRKIQFSAFAETRDSVVLQNPDVTITAKSGDIVLVSRFDTEAFEFPCGYDMQIVLVFGQDRNLEKRFINRFRMCP
jgi:hypothetical protein